MSLPAEADLQEKITLTLTTEGALGAIKPLLDIKLLYAINFIVMINQYIKDQLLIVAVH